MSKEIAEARKVIKKRLEEDEDFLFGYQSNIAMTLYDRYGIVNYYERNMAARDILKIVFNATLNRESWTHPDNQAPNQKQELNQKIVLDPIEDRFEILDL